MSRHYYLDNLKVFLTILVIFHHAGQAYGSGGGWAYHPSNAEEFLPWIWHFFSVNASFFMGLYFLISGYFVPSSYDKQGGSVFVKKKLMRLGVPLLAMGGLISVLSGTFEVAHMWFVESLLVFCLVYALVRCFCKPLNNANVKPNLLYLVAIALVMGIGGCSIRSVSPQDHWIWPFGIIPLPMEPAHYLQYVMMFVIGIVARRLNLLENMSNAFGCASLVIGGLFAANEYMREGNWWGDFVWSYFGLFESFLCVFISFGLLWLFRQCFNGTSKFMEWCSAQSFGAYVVHLLLMLGAQYTFDGVWMGAFGKFLFIGAYTTVLSYVIAWALRCIPGVKKVL